MKTLTRTSTFPIFATLSACAAAYHVAGALGMLSGSESQPLRHAVFVAIGLTGIWYFLRRPIVLLPLFVLLTIQQFGSHGARALRWWTRDGTVDVISLFTLIALSVALVLLMLDARDRSPLVRRIVCPFGPPSDALPDA